ncbi:MAG: hypothetical protein L7F77_03225 [Candidatus Magnetominusculus sp. LBB02]|nr:hypothetical protein [Candidatus Magnetominusculus sp. LBB02]
MPRARELIFWAIVIILAIESYPVRGFYNLLEDKTIPTPEKYIWLKSQSDNAPVLEWPLHTPIDGEGKYVEGSMLHGKPIVNGVSGYQWEGHQRLTLLAHSLDNDAALKAVYAFGIKYLIINADDNAFPLWAKQEIGQFMLVKEFTNSKIYVNPYASTHFPDNEFLKHLNTVTCEESGKSDFTFSFEFRSTDKYYVSQNKMILDILWTTGEKQFTDKLIIYPALFVDTDLFTSTVKKRGDDKRCSDVHSISLLNSY